jgi:hypothetical protein
LSILQALDRWENRLEAIFEGRPYDALDAALTDTISRFPVHIQPFRWDNRICSSYCAIFPRWSSLFWLCVPRMLRSLYTAEVEARLSVLMFVVSCAGT